MWKIIWASYLAWYAYTVMTIDFTMASGDTYTFSYMGSILALCVCYHYGIDLKEWLESIKKLEREVRDLQNELLDMKIQLGLVR